MKKIIIVTALLIASIPAFAQRTPASSSSEQTRVNTYRLDHLEAITTELERCTSDVKERLIKIETTLVAINEKLSTEKPMGVDDMIKYAVLSLLAGGGLLGGGHLIGKASGQRQQASDDAAK